MDLTKPHFIFTPSEIPGLTQDGIVGYVQVSDGFYQIINRFTVPPGTERFYSEEWRNFHSTASEPELKENVRRAFAKILDDHLSKLAQGC